MKKITRLLTMLLSALLILTACATDAAQTPENYSSEAISAKKSESKVAEKTQEVSEKVLTIGVGADLDPFIPISQNEYIRSVCGLTHDTLVAYDKGTIKPCLATSWVTSEDGKEILMRLRDDVTFHDGTKFNAKAAAKSLLYYKDYEMFSWMKGVASIQEVEVVSEYEIKIVYTEPYYAALNDLTSTYKVPMVAPSMIIDGNYETMNEVVGTGAYIYDSYVKGDHTTFVKNEAYWGKDVAFDKIIVRYIPDSGTRLKALQTGEIDMVFSSDFISYDEYQQATSLEGISGQISENPVKTRNLVVNAGSAMLSDVNVRRAIACGIDKEAIVAGLTYYQEQVANRLFDINLHFCDVTLNNTWTYNPQKSAKLLDEAGWILEEGQTIRQKDGTSLELTFTYPNDVALNKEIVSAIISNLKELGIDVKGQGMEFMSWYVDGMEGHYDIAIGTTYGAPYDPHNYLNPMTDSMVDTVAISGLPDAQLFFNALLSSEVTANETEVANLYDYMINYMNDNAVEIPLSYQQEAVLYNDSVISHYDFGGMENVLNPFGITSK